MKTARIFHSESGSTEEWLDVNADGTATYHEENSGWTLIWNGVAGSDSVMSWNHAKAKWPSFADKIDVAIASLASENSN